MSTTLENNNENWFCPRCYRVNISPETDEHCYYGCGYTLNDYGVTVLGWQCPKCHCKNINKLFSMIYRCNQCQYKIDDINDIKFE